MSATNTVIITVLILLAAVHGSVAQDTYYSWFLYQLDASILRVPASTTQSFWDIPIDVEVVSRSGIEHCTPANQPYNFPAGAYDTLQSCPAVECTTANELPIQDHKTDFEFVTHPSLGSQSVTTSLKCGLDVQTNALLFNEPVQVIDQPPCNFSLVQPGINVNVSSINQTATISFTIAPTAVDTTCLKISALDSSGNDVFSTALSSQSGWIANTTSYGLQIAPEITSYKELTFETDFAVVLIGNFYAIFANGEIAMSVDGRDYPIEEMVIEFGSSSYRGSIEDITMYNVAASSNELYSIYTGLPLAKNLIKPECTCPRAYTDSFGLMRLKVHGTRNEAAACTEASQYKQLESLQRYTNNYHGKWGMFTYDDGWVSDFTDEVEIIIRMSQPMLIYGVSGWVSTKLPSAMEVRILGPSDEERAVVYFSNDCEVEYGTTRSYLPVMGVDGRFRRDINVVEPKCYSMDDVFSGISELDDIYETAFGIDVAFDEGFDIPILGPNEGGLLLSDYFSGNISIKFIGHEEMGESTNWYYLSELSLSARPHCGGYNYTIVAAPTTMSEYYNFHKPNARAYSCQCPQGITGDMCESCLEVPGIYRYMKEPGVCTDCDCSDLTRKNAQQCDRTTGQCDCKKSPDLDLAGRQCHWYITEIAPLYGPIAGGTRVTIKGEYLSGINISYLVDIDRRPVASMEPGEEGKYIKFNTAPYRNLGFYDLVIRASTTLDVGPSAKYFKFEYKPDPVLRGIESRTTILSGGTTVTAIGEFFDSVIAPEMIVYLRQNGRIIERFLTTCDIINSTMMFCPTPAMYQNAAPLLEGQIATVPPATEDPSTSTTSAATEATNDSFIIDPFSFNTTTGSIGSTGSTGSTEGAESTGSTESARSTGSTESGLNRRSVHEVFSRTKRSSNSEDVNENYLNDNNNVDFTLGFLYDGLEDYKDLEMNDDEDLKNLSRLYVYDDPNILQFGDEFGEEILGFNPAQEVSISIKGERLDYGVKLSDYEIEIGVEHCGVIDLTSNQITCKPPEFQPVPKDDVYKLYKNNKVPTVKLRAGGYTASVGYIRYTSNIWADNQAFRISMIVFIAVACLAILSLAAFLLVKRYRKNEGISTATVNMDDPSTRYVKQPGQEDEVRLWFPGRKLDTTIQACVDRCKIPQDRLTLGKQLGKGNFGFVYKGQLVTPSGNLRTVAVKSLKDEKEMSFEDMENFLAEGTLMIDFKHENVLSLVGVVVEEGERPLVVLPYMENGDLCTFIKKDDLELVLADMLHFALQIANGMSYLAKHKFVHRDLAARNCMVDGSYIVKIADFGMSRDVYDRDYYKMESMNKPLPMKWMAVESLSEGRFTSKSDVWSYGITVWECLTHGSSPYPGVNNYYIKEYVGTGKRLDKPSICPPIIYEMMCKCWEKDPDNRPTFDEISDFVGKLLKGETIPAAGSDKASGYYYERNTTKHIPDDYLDAKATIEGEDYIIFMPDQPAPPTQGTNTPTKSNTSTPTPAKQLHLPVVNDYVNTEQMVEIYV